MTAVPRRKPQKRTQTVAAEVTWPSYCTPAPRVTSTGKVTSLPSPIQSLWAEAVGRYDSNTSECRGVCVALACLLGMTVEEIATEVRTRAEAARASR